MNGIYQLPEYYEIAFSFRDIPREVDVLEEAARRFAEIPVKTFLEIGCGNSPHMDELTGRGYDFIGIDISDEMLTYSREKAELGLLAGVQPDIFRLLDHGERS